MNELTFVWPALALGGSMIVAAYILRTGPKPAAEKQPEHGPVVIFPPLPEPDFVVVEDESA